MLEKAAERALLESHASNTVPELVVCEEDLGCAIEGVGKDQLLIRFADLRIPGRPREFSFVLDISSTGYKGTLLSYPPEASYQWSFSVDMHSAHSDPSDFARLIERIEGYILIHQKYQTGISGLACLNVCGLRYLS